MFTIVNPTWTWISHPDPDQIMEHLEKCGRTCYKSEDCITAGSADKFVRMICRRNHESVLEHASLTVRVVCSRACSHQIVRHRLCAYSQESQRYCNYGKKGFQVVAPQELGLHPGEYTLEHHWKCDGVRVVGNDFWLTNMNLALLAYSTALETMKPEDARFLLPNACKTEIAMTANLRMWRHIFRERALNQNAQWEIRRIFGDMYVEFRTILPAVFGDL